MSNLECLFCKQEFNSNKYNPNQKYCSKKCKISGDKLHLTQKPCGNCVICNSDLFRKTAKTCSNECRRQLQLSESNPLRKRIILNCDNCGIEFEVRNHKKDVSRFCSISCSTKFQNREFPKNSSKIIKKCQSCGDNFITWLYRKDSKFCSRKCHYSIGRIQKTCCVCNSNFVTNFHQNRTFCSKKCSVKYCGPSLVEDFVFEHIKNKLGPHYIKRQEIIKTENNLYTVDFLISNNIILEVFGDYWHCNPNSFKSDFYHTQIKKTAEEIWKHDVERIDDLKLAGFEIFVVWENNDNKENLITEIETTIQKIKQLIILPYPQIEPIEVDELSETSRGEGGFGSTGS